MDKTRVCITVDTEHSIGGAFGDRELSPVGNEKRIYGRVGTNEYGIPLIMKIAESHSIQLTFFVEVMNYCYFGQSETRDVVRFICTRGHDVQLHIHPNYLNFKNKNSSTRRFSDHMCDYGLDEQIDIIRNCRDLLTEYSGRPPIAFRAGNYSANLNTLRALKENCMRIDSSCNACIPRNDELKSAGRGRNDATLIESIWEYPITNFKSKAFCGVQLLKPLDLNGVSFSELRSVLEQAQIRRHPQYITLILHSFSFLKAKDLQYRNVEIREYVIERFQRLCRYLSEHQSRFAVLKMCDLEESIPDSSEGENSVCFPSVSWKLSLVRNIQQLCDLSRKPRV